MLLSKISESGSKVKKKKKKKKKALENDPKFTGWPGGKHCFFCLFLPRYCSWGTMEDTTALV